MEQKGNLYKVLIENLEGLSERVLMSWILNKLTGRIQTRFFWLRIEATDSLL
jgi:hypothetical protein